jgi:hypothetical protein
MKAAEDAAIFSAKSIQTRKKARHDSLFCVDPQPTCRARPTFPNEDSMEALVRTLFSVSSSVAKAGDNVEAIAPRSVPCEGSMTERSAGGRMNERRNLAIEVSSRYYCLVW